MSSIVMAFLEIVGVLAMLLAGMAWADRPATAAPGRASGGIVSDPPATVERIVPISDLQKGRFLIEAQAIAAHEWPRVWDDALQKELSA